MCKYFKIKADEETLSQFEEVLNDFEAAKDGKVSLQKEKQKILESIKGNIPVLIRKFSRKKLEKNLKFEKIYLKILNFPKYTFKYVSLGGNKLHDFDL